MLMHLLLLFPTLILAHVEIIKGSIANLTSQERSLNDTCYSHDGVYDFYCAGSTYQVDGAQWDSIFPNRTYDSYMNFTDDQWTLLTKGYKLGADLFDTNGVLVLGQNVSVEFSKILSGYDNDANSSSSVPVTSFLLDQDMNTVQWVFNIFKSIGSEIVSSLRVNTGSIATYITNTITSMSELKECGSTSYTLTDNDGNKWDIQVIATARGGSCSTIASYDTIREAVIEWLLAAKQDSMTATCLTASNSGSWKVYVKLIWTGQTCTTFSDIVCQSQWSNISL